MAKEKTYTGTILYQRKRGDEPVKLSGSREVSEWANKVFFDVLDEVDGDKEHFIGITMNARNEVKSARLLCIGCLTGSLVHPREVFKPAVLDSAASMIMVHNHPSGDPTPSPEDIQLTDRLVEAGRILGIRVLDHVVCAFGGYSSLMDRRG